MRYVTVKGLKKPNQPVSPHALCSPLVAATSLSHQFRPGFWLKLEILQETRFFKLRGVVNASGKLPAYLAGAILRLSNSWVSRKRRIPKKTCFVVSAQGDALKC